MGDMRIMLVDDNGDLRRGMRDYLARQEGIKVVAECPSGAEALEALGKVRVDVMVLDLIMPQMDGFALMEEVRRQQLANPPQIIVVSALGRDDFIMRAVQLGARFYMVKPFDMASLAARIRESCGQGVVPLGTALNASARSLSIDEKLGEPVPDHRDSGAHQGLPVPADGGEDGGGQSGHDQPHHEGAVSEHRQVLQHFRQQGGARHSPRH